MVVTITFPSALRFWLSASSLRLPNYIKKVRFLPENMAEGRIPFDELADVAETYNLKLPLHLTVPDAARRSSSENICFHTLHRNPPEYGYICLSDNVYISTPELSLIEAADHLDFHVLVKAGTDICANYVRNKNAVIFQSKREPVASPGSIRELAMRTSVAGAKKTRTAAKYILAGSNSPIETDFGVLCRLPIMYGGYAADYPELNLVANLSEKAAQYLGRDKCLLDIGWKKSKVGLEYDSNLTHLDINQHYYDKRKATALSLSGYKMMYVTAEQIKNFRSVETVMGNLRKLLGMQPRTKDFEKYLELRQRVVRDLLFEKNDQYDLFN